MIHLDGAGSLILGSAFACLAVGVAIFAAVIVNPALMAGAAVSGVIATTIAYSTKH